MDEDLKCDIESTKRIMELVSSRLHSHDEALRFWNEIYHFGFNKYLEFLGVKNE